MELFYYRIYVKSSLVGKIKPRKNVLCDYCTKLSKIFCQSNNKLHLLRDSKYVKISVAIPHAEDVEENRLF